MKYLVGLGNPGLEYKNTRHNVGHFMVDQIGEIPGFELVKTDCFMNKSGQFVADLVKSKNIDLNDLIIIHDDWAFEIGDFRIQKGRSSNRHNGVQDVINQLGSKDFWRIRVGIGTPPAGVEANDYVLGKFSPKEKETLLKIETLVKTQLLLEVV